ncbi:MAG: hypothetical protein P8N60_12965, partial [Burkholderiaceae bacterium]|nr:hypothetical protein [Burkholderiaceae bacterium]
KCLKVWGNAKEKRAINEQTIQSRRLQHQIETVQTLKPMSQSLLGEINPSASNHLKTDTCGGCVCELRSGGGDGSLISRTVRIPFTLFSGLVITFKKFTNST